MALNLFGYEIKRKAAFTTQESEKDKGRSFVPHDAEDGATEVTSNSHALNTIELNQNFADENELITKYREMSYYPEVDNAITDIVSDSIIDTELEKPVNVILDELEVSDSIKDKISEEFDNVLNLLDFNNKGSFIYRRWYIDGRIYYHKVIDKDRPKKGITDLRFIDPMKIKKVRHIEKERNDKNEEVVKSVEEYFIYSPEGFSSPSQNGLKIYPEAISYASSGMVDVNKKFTLSYLHKAIRPFNHLKMIEDGLVIYRLARAPERRVFRIDVGELPRGKAEAYMKEQINRHKNKIVYDAKTGELKSDKDFMAITEDFWFPIREGRGTQVDTLSGGDSLAQIDDVEYFKQKLYHSLNVPISRLDNQQGGLNLTRGSEITRDELKFARFVAQLRKRFSMLFNDILATQLILKNIITEDDWTVIKDQIQYDFLKDNYFFEAKNLEVIRDRVNLLRDIEPYIGRFYSVEYVQKNILQLNDEEISEMEKQISKDKKEGKIPDQDDNSSGRLGFR